MTRKKKKDVAIVKKRKKKKRGETKIFKEKEFTIIPPNGK